MKDTQPTPAQLAALMRRAGAPVTDAMITADVAAGAPTNPDGTMNLILYVAWLLKRERDGDRPEAA